MNQKNFNFLLVIAGIVLFAGLGYTLRKPKTELNQLNSITAAPTPQTQTYDNMYMNVTTPIDWHVAQVPSNPGGVNITKGNYILYINTLASQASGVEGGRFSEIAMGAPSIDAVIKEHPVPPCGTSNESSLSSSSNRVDLYISKSETHEYCNTPSDDSTKWYFPYISPQNGGYFNYYNSEDGKALVVTMAYNSKNIADLPDKDSESLRTALNEMTSILNTLQIKDAAKI